MIILLHETLVLVEKTEKCRQNFIRFVQNLVKTIFLDKEKKKKCDAYFGKYSKQTLNEKNDVATRKKVRFLLITTSCFFR